MIETKVPMDIRSYKAKFIGPFTTRQLVCVAASACVDAALYFAIAKPLDVPIRLAVFVMALIDVPILSFIFEPLGMPMEKYVKDVLLRALMAPTKRRAKGEVGEKKARTYTSKEMKASKKKMKKLVKTHPEYKAYK